jgi:[ribosomal protein S18]-alanine N-acetyltransferase
MQPDVLISQRKRLRSMQTGDLDAVAAIEARAYSHPWTRGNFADSLAARYGCVVLQCEEAIAGYAIVMNAVDDLHLLNITVGPDFQGLRLSHTLMAWVEDSARIANCSGILLEVRPSNQRARDIYTALGFVQIGVRPNYYPHFHGREDAVVMRKPVGGGSHATP